MDYEKNAIEILRMIGSNNGFTVADSGGKDSSVLTHIAMKAGCPFDVIHNHTTVDAPETVYFIREKFKRLRAAGIKAEIVMPKETMWQLIVRKKTPPTIAERLGTLVRKLERDIVFRAAAADRAVLGRCTLHHGAVQDELAVGTAPLPERQVGGGADFLNGGFRVEIRLTGLPRELEDEAVRVVIHI